MIAELSLEQKIGTQPKKIWQDFQMQIMFIAVDFDTYKELEFLKVSTHNIVL